MKNRRQILKFMKTKDEEYRFTIRELTFGTGLKSTQIDYEIKKMILENIVDKLINPNDLRGSFYVQGTDFENEYQSS